MQNVKDFPGPFQWKQMRRSLNRFHACPGLFRDYEHMPDELKSHLRYPEDLFRLQTTSWAKYSRAISSAAREWRA